MEHVDPRNLPDMPELMIAGPGELHEEDLGVLGQQLIAHYGDVWMDLHNDTLRRMGELLGSADTPYIIPGTGTTCLDAAVANLFEPGQRLVVANTGFFGNRLKEVALAQRCEVVELEIEPIGAPIDPASIADAARGCDGVLTVHVETATGTAHPIAEIAEAAHEAGAFYLVDGIASVGGELVDVDGMGIDALVTGTQKGLEAPPGFGIVALGPRGRERVESRSEPPQSWYLDLKRWDWYREQWPWHPHPVTMPTTSFLALASSVARILETGVDAWVQRRASLADKLRAGLTEVGLEIIPPSGYEANLVVAAWTGAPDPIIDHLMTQEGIAISAGLTPTAGKAIRVGLMGRTATEEMVERVVAGVGAALERRPEPEQQV